MAAHFWHNSEGVIMWALAKTLKRRVGHHAETMLKQIGLSLDCNNMTTVNVSKHV